MHTDPPPNAISMLNIQLTIYAKRNTILQKGKGGGGGGGERKVKLANLPNTSVCGCMLSLRSFFFSGNHGSKFQDV